MYEEILVEAIGGATALYAATFSYYSLRNARLMQGPVAHRLMAAGAVLFVLAVAIGAVGVFLNLPFGLAVFITWLIALFPVAAGGILRVKSVTKVYKIPLTKALLMFRHVKYYLFSVIILVFIGVPFFLLDMLVQPGFDWFSVGTALIWTAAFVLLTVSERTLGTSALIEMEKVPHKLWRKEIQLLRARLDLTNGYLGGMSMLTGMTPISKIVGECSQENRELLHGYKLEMPGKLAMKPLIENLESMSQRKQDQEIFKTFSCLDAALITAHARLTSPQNATAVVNRSFKEGIKTHGALLHDYILPALLFGNVLEPVLMKCGKETRRAVEEEMRKVGKVDPLARGIRVEEDGRIDLTQLYRSLAPLSREDRIKRTISVFSAVQRSVHLLLVNDLGPEASQMIHKAHSRLGSEFPELRKFIAKSRVKFG
jgi:hypothetical protein